MFSPLVFHWNVDPVLFHIGPIEIRYYSLLFVAGFVLGYYIFKNYFKREKIDEAVLDPLLYTLLIATIVGARLGHCIFYQPDYYFGSWAGFWEIFMPWRGGLASHGGAIALIIAMIWYARKYGPKQDFDFWWIMDRLVITVCFAGAFIRLGNLFNSEIYGDVTSLPWGVVYERNGETLPKHPTQIYESLSYLVLGIVLTYLYNKKADKLYRGEVFGIFLIVLFGVRFLIEFVKEPQVMFEQNMVLNMGQLLSIPFILAGVVILIVSLKKKNPFLAVHAPQQMQPKSPTHYAHSK